MATWVLMVWVLALALLGCDSRPGAESKTRGQAAEEQVAGWCRACPTWCDPPMRRLPPDALLYSYRRAAIHHGYKERTTGDAWEILQRLACMVKTEEPDTQQRFLQFLEDDDVAVRYCAAVHALGHQLGREAPVQVLREIAAGSSVLAVHAAVRLQEWEVGITVEL